MRSLIRYAAIVILILIFVLCGLFWLRTHGHSAEARKFEETYASENAANPKNLKIVLKTENGRAQFRRGELIRLQTEYSSSDPNAFIYETPYFWWSDIENNTVHLDTSEGWTDPLNDYYACGCGHMAGSSAMSSKKISSEPLTTSFILNQQVRFDRTGKYRVYTSTKAIRRQGGERWNGKYPVSNIVEFEIVESDAAWVSQTLRSALAGLNLPEESKERAEATQVLKYLDSEESIRELILRMGSDSIYGATEALVGSSHRQFALSQLQERIKAPDQIVDSGYLDAISILSLPPGIRFSPFQIRSRKEYERVEGKIRANAQAFLRLRQSYTKELARAIPQKNATALPVSILTAMEGSAQFSAKKQQLEIRHQLAPYLTRLFPSLDKGKQYTILDFWWDDVNHAALVPALREIVKHPQQRGMWEPDIPMGFTDLALRRLLSTAPDEGWAVVISDLRCLDPRFSDDFYMGITPRALPDIDEAIASNIEGLFRRRQLSDMNRLIYFARRYASVGATPRLKHFYQQHANEIGCDVQSQLLAYFKQWDALAEADLFTRSKDIKINPRCYAQVTDAPVNLYPLLPD